MPADADSQNINDSQIQDTNAMAEAPAADAPGSSPAPAAGAPAVQPADTADKEAAGPADGKSTRFQSVLNVLGIGKKEQAASEQAKVPPQDKTAAAGKAQQPGVKAPAAGADGKQAADSKTAAEDGNEGTPEVPAEVANHPAYKQVTAQLAEAKDGHDRFTQITSFMDDHGISGDTMKRGMELMALQNKDPEAFFKEVEGIYREFGEALGKFLPPDLQDKVDGGFLTEEDAKSIAKDRTKAAMAERRAAQSENHVQQTNIAEARRQNLTMVQNWFAKAGEQDPDIEEKATDIHAEFLRLISIKGQPRDQRAAWSLLNEAHKGVNDRIARYRPAQPTARVPANSLPAGDGNRPAAAPTRLNMVENILARASSA